MRGECFHKHLQSFLFPCMHMYRPLIGGQRVKMACQPLRHASSGAARVFTILRISCHPAVIPARLWAWMEAVFVFVETVRMQDFLEFLEAGLRGQCGVPIAH